MIDNNLNPVWNHTGEIAGLSAEKQLRFQVWDSNTKPLPDELIGAAILQAGRLRLGGEEIEVKLELTGTHATGSLLVRIMEAVD